jgi:hypothetical protein
MILGPVSWSRLPSDSVVPRESTAAPVAPVDRGIGNTQDVRAKPTYGLSRQGPECAEDLPLTVAAKTQLLFGPYRPPKLHKGDRAFCLLRDSDVVITS